MSITGQLLVVSLLAGTFATANAASSHFVQIGPFVHGPPSNVPLDGAEKLVAKLDDVTTLLKIAAEEIGSLESLLSLMKKTVDDWTYTVFTDLYNLNFQQNTLCHQLGVQVDNITTELDELEASLNTTEACNGQNLNGLVGREGQAAAAKQTGVAQDGQIAQLQYAIKDLKSKLLTVTENEFKLFDNKVKLVDAFLDEVTRLETSRMCENGEVTLPSDDRRAEVLFQTSFASTPQVQFSIKGFDFDLDSRPQPPPSYRYGYFVQYTEPNAIGVTTNAIASKTGVTFEAVDLSFGDTRLRSVTIAYQACTIGPGTELSGAHGTAVLTTTTPATTTV